MQSTPASLNAATTRSVVARSGSPATTYAINATRRSERARANASASRGDRATIVLQRRDVGEVLVATARQVDEDEAFAAALAREAQCERERVGALERGHDPLASREPVERRKCVAVA